MGNIMKGMFNSTLKRFLAVAMAGSLVVTSGMFAYAFTSDTISITTSTGFNDFAEISGSSNITGYQVFGSYRGTIVAGRLFNVTTTDYPGDLLVNVYLANPDELGKNYGLWMLRVKMVDGSGVYADEEGITKVLSLNNGMVSFITDGLSDNDTYYIETTGGVFRTFPWAYLNLGGTFPDPSLYAEVLQAGG